MNKESTHSYGYRVFLLACVLGCVAMGPGCGLSGDEMVVIDQYNPNGTMVRTVLLSNVRYTGNHEGYQHLSRRAAAKKLVAEGCKHFTKESKEDGYVVVSCGISRLPALFGAALGGPGSHKPGQLDAVGVLRTISMSASQKKYGESFRIDTSGGLSMHGEAKSMGKDKEGGFAHCTHFIQSPYPINSTNADIVMSRYNLAGWNCNKSRKGTKYRIEMTSSR